MRKPLVLGLVAASACAGHGVVQAQMTSEVREKLLAGEVVIRDAQVYAMASGAQRGTFEGTQEWLVTRAMRSIANKLCAFTPTPGRRLEAAIQGVTRVSSETRGSEVVVVIKAPLQNPACKVTVVELVAPPSAAPVPAEAQRSEETPPRSAEPGEPRSPEIVIRKFGGEY